MRKNIITLLFAFIFLLSCKLLFIKNLAIKGEVFLSSKYHPNSPINAKIILLDEKLKLITSIDSTFGGNYKFTINKKHYKEKMFLVISDIKLFYEENKELVSKGLARGGIIYIHCQNKYDTIPIPLNYHSIYIDINIENCELESTETETYPYRH